MHEVIWLRVSPRKVEGMTKRLPDLNRGEIPVKLIIDVAPTAFREPVIERTVEIIDWRDGLDLGDLDLKESTITEAEAQLIRDRRLAAMRRILEDQGYEVREPVVEAVVHAYECESGICNGECNGPVPGG